MKLIIIFTELYFNYDIVVTRFDIGTFVFDIDTIVYDIDSQQTWR
jgi:hypothetical protein